MSRFSEEESPSLTGINEVVTSMLMGNLVGKVFSFLTPAAFYRLQTHDELCVLGQNILLEEIIHPLLGEKEKKVNIFKYFYEEAPKKKTPRNMGKEERQNHTANVPPNSTCWPPAPPAPPKSGISSVRHLASPCASNTSRGQLSPFSTFNHFFLFLWESWLLLGCAQHVFTFTPLLETTWG